MPLADGGSALTKVVLLGPCMGGKRKMREETQISVGSLHLLFIRSVS